MRDGDVLEYMGLMTRHKRKQTNEEWLRQAGTEELAEFIRKQRDDWSDGWYSDWHRFEEIVEWLKRPHTTKE